MKECDEKVELVWTIRILNALHSSGSMWGCLSTNNKLFTIADFEKVDVPQKVVTMLVDEGVIRKQGGFNDTYYELVCKED